MIALWHCNVIVPPFFSPGEGREEDKEDNEGVIA